MPLTVPPGQHPRAKELAALDRLLEDTPALAEMVARDLPHTEGASPTNGRPGMTGDQVLRAAIVRSLEGCSYEDLAFHIADS